MRLPLCTVKTAIVAHAGTWTVFTNEDPFAAGFRVNGYLSFWDGTGPYTDVTWPTGIDHLPSQEEVLTISAVDPVAKSITVNSSALGYTNGFQYDHHVGATILSNIRKESTLKLQDSLNSGYPFVWVAATATRYTHDDSGGRGTHGTTRTWTPVQRVYIDYTRNLIPPTKIDKAVYSERQQDESRQDTDAITLMLLLNPKLPVNGQDNARMTGPADPIQNWRRQPAESVDQYTLGTEFEYVDLQRIVF